MNLEVDAHVHTISSGHAYSTISEYVAQAKKIGLKAIAITDHGPNMTGASSLFHFNNLHILPKTIDGIRVFTGIEANILSKEGDIDAPVGTISKLDVSIASLHDVTAKIDKIEDVTEAYINTMKNTCINIIGHPCDVRYPFDLEEVVQAAKKYSVAFEVNNASMNKDSYRYDPNESIIDLLKLCEKHDVFITVNTDSHYVDYLGDFSNAMAILEKANFPERLVLNASLERFEAFVRFPQIRIER